MENKETKQKNPSSENDVLDLALKTDGAEKGYEIVLHSKFLTIDEEVNKRLKQAGFTNEQAQLVYDLASEIMIPKIKEVIDEFKLYKELSKLENYFGGEERFDEIARQISLWAEKNLPNEIYESLNSTFYGVVALYNMMTSGEPKVMGKSCDTADVITENKLKEMMKDPKYWRDNDKDFIKKINDGFKFLYGEE